MYRCRRRVEDRTALRELGWALDRLPPDQREALCMIVLQEKSLRRRRRSHRLRDRYTEEPGASRAHATPDIPYGR